MSSILAQAQKIRAAMDAAGAALTDEQAAGCIELFPAWDSAGVDYVAGSRVKHSGVLYQCVSPHRSQSDWVPGTAPSLWTRIDDPAIAWPAWRQPQGAHDAYALGAQVSHGGVRYVSAAAGNVWEPPTQWTAQK